MVLLEFIFSLLLKNEMKYITLATVILLILSCNKKDLSTTVDVIPQYEIDINNINKSDQSLSSIITDFSFIELSRIPMEDFIAETYKTIFFENEYYLLDIKKSNVLVFDQAGIFQRKIGKRGNGPGEFKTVDDFVINKSKKEIALLGLNDIALYVFKTDGKFVKKIFCPEFFPKKIGLINDQYYAFYTSYSSNALYDIIYTDLDGKIINGSFDFPADVDQLAFEYVGGVRSVGNTTLYTGSASSIIYEINKDRNASAKYRIDFGKDSWKEEDKFELHRFDRELEKMNLYYLGNKYLELDNFLIFPYTKKNKVKKAYYNFSTNTLYTTDSFNKDGLDRLFDNIIGIKDHHLLVAFDPQYYEAIKKVFPGFETALKAMDSDLYQVLEETNENSSTFILKFKLDF